MIYDKLKPVRLKYNKSHHYLCWAIFWLILLISILSYIAVIDNISLGEVSEREKYGRNLMNVTQH